MAMNEGYMTSILFWIIITLTAGLLLPIQAGLNTKLGKAAESPVHASLVSFIVGCIALYAYILSTQQSVNWVGVKSAPAPYWLGGIIGAIYVTVSILAYPKLGPGLTFGLIVAGQMLMSLFLEHQNILVQQPSAINPMKLLGVALIIIGVIIIRKHS
jgi:transporter family-2 protein